MFNIFIYIKNKKINFLGIFITKIITFASSFSSTWC